MVSYNCMFFSLHFILTIDFMMIESTKKVSPSYYVNNTLTLLHVNTVNNLVTYNQNKIKFSDKERTVLTTPVQTYNDTKDRNSVFDKFDKKIEDVRCTCSVIVKSKLSYLSNILEGLQSGGAIEVAKDKITILKEEAGLIVLMFQISRVKAGKWFWSYYFKIMAIIEYESNKNFFGEIPFNEEDLQSNITDFLKYCKDNNYLPKYRTEFGLISKNPNVPTNMFQILRVSIDYPNVMQNISIEFLYLRPLWDEHELLFNQITGSAVEWGPTIRRHAVEVNRTKEYVENRQWISKPFGHLSYHRLIKQIINTRAYIFLWIMLVIFDKKLPNMDENSVNIIFTQTTHTINTVFEFMAYTDPFFYDIATEYHWTMPEDTNLGNLIDRISVRARGSLVELNGSISNGNDWISITVNDELSNDMMMEFLNAFANNFNQLKSKLGPFGYVLAMSLLSEGE